MRYKASVVAAIVSVLALALGATAVTASAALPELVNANGTAPVNEWFESTTSVSAQIETDHPKSEQVLLECSGSKVLGVVTGTKTAKLRLTYTGCKLIKWGGIEVNETCSGPGQPSGTTVGSLVSTLVYLNEGHTVVGWHFEPGTKNGTFLELSCPGPLGKSNIRLGVKEAEKGGEDGLLSAFVGPYKTKTTELTPVLKCTAPGKQEYTSFWESLKIPAFLEAEISKGTSWWETACIRSTGDALRFEESVEIKA